MHEHEGTPVNATTTAPGRRQRWTRAEVAQRLADADAAQRVGESQRGFAVRAGVHRSTLRGWLCRAERSALPEELARFFETPAGVYWLRRLVIAAILAITQLGPSGIRVVCTFLELAGLSEVVGASFGSVRVLVASVQEQLARFGKEQTAQLAKVMKDTEITLCQDETFHPSPLLVAQDPVSGFVVLERYAERRDAATWSQYLDEALAGLPVRVVQSTSDEARALLRHASELGAHHAPDLFHVQYEVSGAQSRVLQRRVRAAEAECQVARARLAMVRAEHAQYLTRPRRRGRPPDFGKRIDRARESLVAARHAWWRAQADQDEARFANRGIGEAYHAYELQSGAFRSPEQVRADLVRHFDELDAIAERAALSERGRKRIDKARKLVESMVETVAFAHTRIDGLLASLVLTDAEHRDVRTRLVPALYLLRFARSSPRAAQRRQLEAVAARLLQPLQQGPHPLRLRSDAERDHIVSVAQRCADILQRSSSCVEGRNGQLALHHHGAHRISDRALRALSTVHNFLLRRPDGTTAAQRFFGAEHDDLFDALVQRVATLPRPAAKRPRPLPRPLLPPAAPASAPTDAVEPGASAHHAVIEAVNATAPPHPGQTTGLVEACVRAGARLLRRLTVGRSESDHATPRRQHQTAPTQGDLLGNSC